MMIKKWSARLALAVTVGATLLALPSAPVSASTCPAPGTGLAGAANMRAAVFPDQPDVGMLHAMSVDDPNGNAGMHSAVVNTSC